jgi:hypothetical protein
MSVFKRVLAAHEYETREGKKTSWKEVGIITQNDKGNMFLSLHHLPNQKFNLFDPDPPREATQTQRKPAKSFDDLDDDVPAF